MRASLSVVLAALGVLGATAFAQQSMTFDWEDGVSTALGTMYNAVLENTTAQAQSGTHSLKYTKSPNSGSTPQAYIWWITGCADGDVIDASFYVYDVTPGTYPSGRIWAHYTSDPSNINSYSGSASGPSAYSSGTGWEQMTGQWVFASSGDDDGIVIEARIYATAGQDSTIYIDNASVTTTSSTAIIHNAGGGVPVELTSFAAAAGKGEITLTWSTASELDNMGFNILRAVGASSRVLVNREIIPGAGTSPTPHRYDFVDRDVVPATTYRYWLEQVDFTGTSEFFGPITAGIPEDLPGGILVSVSPQPVRGSADIRFTLPQSGDATVVLHDLQGRMVAKVWQGSAAGSQTLRWERSGVPAGLYMLRVVTSLGSAEHPVILN